jgi:hypothetical protein
MPPAHHTQKYQSENTGLSVAYDRESTPETAQACLLGCAKKVHGHCLLTCARKKVHGHCLLSGVRYSCSTLLCFGGVAFVHVSLSRNSECPSCLLKRQVCFVQNT